jgi:TIGR03009 family protein
MPMRWIGRRILGITSLVCIVVAAARGQAPDGRAPAAPAQAPRPAPAGQPAAPAAQPADPERAAKAAQMEALLRQWEQVSRSNEMLFAEFTRTDRSKAWPEPKVYEGVALLRKPNLACIEFKLREQGQPKPTFYERIVCSGDNRVYQFQGPTRQCHVYILPDDERRRALEEGPLPFIFNMRLEQARARYYWDLWEETPAKDGESAKYIIRIIPKQAIDREEFSMALVMLDQTTFLPSALRLYAPNGKDMKTFVFTKVERNQEQNPASNPNNYDGARMAAAFQRAGYKVIVNDDPAGVQNAGSTARPVAQPAQRPGMGRR